MTSLYIGYSINKLKEQKQIITICIDGFDPEYFEYIDTPNINLLIKKGFYKIGKSMWPSVTNVNNVSIITGEYPNKHGICSNYRYIQETNEEIYMESNEYILCPTIFNRAKSKGIITLIATSKDKLRTLLGKDATHIISSEKPNKWLIDKLGEPPPIYSIEINSWTIDAARYAIEKYTPEFAYITTTDFAMHKFPLNSKESNLHFKMIDKSIGKLINQYSNATFFITADHGMSNKTNLVDLGHILKSNNIDNHAVPIIKDKYIAHHSNLGGAYIIYLDKPKVEESLNILNKTEGVDIAINSNQACKKYKLNYERIGQIIVSGKKDTVFGNSSEIDLPKGLRSHGSEHEMNIPLIGYNLNNPEFIFKENKDIGNYIIKELKL